MILWYQKFYVLYHYGVPLKTPVCDFTNYLISQIYFRDNTKSILLSYHNFDFVITISSRFCDVSKSVL